MPWAEHRGRRAILEETLIEKSREYPSRLTLPAFASGPPSTETATPTPWLTVTESAERARCGVKVIYAEVRAGRLKAARIGGRRELRLLPEWIDQWLIAQTTIL
jgi:excisionase family DNA binding protein